MEQPTPWEWVGFWASMALLGYACWHLISGLLSGARRAQAETGQRDSSKRGLHPAIEVAARMGDWTIDYLYLPIWRALVGVLRALLRDPPAPAQRATVSTISVPLPAAYVAGMERMAHQNAPSAPSAVRPSVSSAPDPDPRAVARPALERLTTDRSREALLDALVAAGWSTTQIRSQLRGANDALGAEVEAARRRLEAPRSTPVAGRELGPGVEFRATPAETP